MNKQYSYRHLQSVKSSKIRTASAAGTSASRYDSDSDTSSSAPSDDGEIIDESQEVLGANSSDRYLC